MNQAVMLSGNHESTLLVQALIDHTSSVIYVKDVEFRYLLINRQFENLFHLSRSQILGKTDFDIFSTELAEEFRANDQRVLESGEPLQCEEVAPQDDGHHRYLSLKFPLRDVQGTIYAIAGISADITDRIRADHEIASLQLKHVEIEQEIQTARRIQMSLNPKQIPTIPGFDFAAISVPCSKACGDYYDFIPWGKNRLGIAVGDVSGHGLGAALEMVETRAILRTTILSENDPVQCLMRLNEILSEDLPDDMFVTLFLATLNTYDRTLTYAAAGHDAVVLSANNEVQRLESTGMVLGWSRSTKFASGGTLTMQSGDILLVATDGIAETVSPTRRLFGRDRIVDVLQEHRLRSAGEILDAIRIASDAFREREPQRDDVTAVVVKAI